jgi:integrase
VRHFAAMDYQDVPALMAELGNISTVSAVTLRFVILTAARTGEVLGARWSEIDWGEKTWTVPAARAKTHRDHVNRFQQVPLRFCRGLSCCGA